MSGKPAARIGDTVICPKCGQNAVVTGISSVILENMPAATATQGCACGSTITGNVIPNVLIGGFPAATQGSTGSHGSVVTSGAGSVLIGNSFTPAPFTPPAPMNLGAAARAMPASPSLPSLPQRPSPPVARTWQETPDDPAPLGLEEEEEEEELEEQVQQGITLRIGVFFDGTGNNSSNSEVGAQCRAAALNIGEQESLAIYQRCKSYQLDTDSSYANDVSNIWRLYELYREDAKATHNDGESRAYLPVYVTGIGTVSGEKDTLIPGQAWGQGATGVLAKVAEGVRSLEKALIRFKDENTGVGLAKLELDIFGFSRGAAAARHFANQVLKREQGPLGDLLLPGKVKLATGFDWQTDVTINFIGLFDTVAAIGGWDDWGNPGDAINGGVELYLAPNCARQVVHLVARDEYRRNFALNRVASPHREIILPGAHSDLGGGYQPEATERLYLMRPRSNWVSRATLPENTPAYRDALIDTRHAHELGLLDPQDPSAKLGTDVWEHFLPFSGGRADQMKYVLAAPFIERKVYGHLSRAYLRVMHALALEAGVPLNRIQEKDPSLTLPKELESVSKKLVAWARGGNGALDEEEERLLRQRYIHLSANWNAGAGQGGSTLDVVFINAPAEHERARHASTPGGNTR
ncbi:MAG: phospholipase effector Tle1 domain-containing protein [Methylocystis sp.]|uniref:phospholipase effector Tle1 domain-containing protein n=1 Tax=Methylocystis sp. TaxID=1911079 RepID=UPI003DA31E75